MWVRDPLATGLLIICVGKTKRFPLTWGQQTIYSRDYFWWYYSSKDLESEINESFNTAHTSAAIEPLFRNSWELFNKIHLFFQRLSKVVSVFMRRLVQEEVAVEPERL